MVKRMKSRRSAAKARPENEIQKTTEMMKKAKAKSRRVRGGARPGEEAAMAQHAELVLESGETSVMAIIETGRRLLAAKKEISHGGWRVFIEQHLRWAQSSVTALIRIARAFQDQGADIVSTLPGDQRTLVDLARLPASGLKQLVAKHKGSLASVSRADLRADITKLLPGTTRRSRGERLGERPASSSTSGSRSPVDGADPAFSDPVWAVGNLHKLVSERGFALTEDERSLILQKLDEIRAELEASAAPTLDVELEPPASEELEDVAAELDEDDDEPEENGELAPDEEEADEDEGEAAQEDDPAEEAPPSRYRRLKRCAALTAEEFATLRPAAEYVVTRGRDGVPFCRLPGVGSTDSATWEDAPPRENAPTAASTRAGAKGVKLRALPSGGGKPARLASPEGAPKPRRGAR